MKCAICSCTATTKRVVGDHVLDVCPLHRTMGDHVNTEERFRYYLEQMEAVGGVAHREALRVTMRMMLDAGSHPDDVWQWASDKLKIVAHVNVFGKEGV